MDHKEDLNMSHSPILLPPYQSNISCSYRHLRNQSHLRIIICILKICNVGNAEFKCHITCGCHLNTVSKQSKTCNIRTCGNIILLYNLLAYLIKDAITVCASRIADGDAISALIAVFTIPLPICFVRINISPGLQP